jgi:nitrate/TMAO reductase-like tetraheme cytochrome c subunit
MEKRGLLLIIVIILAMFFVSTAVASEYTGSDMCFKCHPEQYNDWKTSGHPYKLRPASVAKYAALPLPKAIHGTI